MTEFKIGDIYYITGFGGSAIDTDYQYRKFEHGAQVYVVRNGVDSDGDVHVGDGLKLGYVRAESLSDKPEPVTIPNDGTIYVDAAGDYWLNASSQASNTALFNSRSNTVFSGWVVTDASMIWPVAPIRKHQGN